MSISGTVASGTGITHLFATSKADGSDATQVQGTNWNAAHVISSGSIQSGALGAGSVISVNFQSGGISSGALSSGAIYFGIPSSGAITSGTIGQGSIVSGIIASGIFIPAPLITNIQLSGSIVNAVGLERISGVLSSGLTSGSITLPIAMPDSNYYLWGSPNYITTIAWSGKTTTGFTYTLGTAPTTGSGLIDWIIVR